MNLQVWWYVAGAFFVLGLLLLLIWRKIRTSPLSDRWAALSAAASVISLFIGLASLIFAVAGERDNPPPATTAGAVESNPDYRPLPDDPEKKQLIIDELGIVVDKVCQDLGRSDYAWLPGQTADQDYVNRQVFGDGQVGKWTCGGPLSPTNPPIKSEAMSKRCVQEHSPGWDAFYWDPNNAYSWYCDEK